MIITSNPIQFLHPLHASAPGESQHVSKRGSWEFEWCVCAREYQSAVMESKREWGKDLVLSLVNIFIRGRNTEK